MAKTSDYSSPIYRRGSRGPVVGEIQTMLGKGYTDLNGVVDNNYGPITRDAVWNWQTQWNNANPNDQIKVDGKVGPETLPRLTQWYQAQQTQQPVVEQPQPVVTQPQTTPQQPVAATAAPKIDTTNAIGSLAEILGPTPAEREAREQKLERNRQQMTMWAALFDGLRQLGNLYYTTKGATPQQLETPYKQIDENYQRDIKRLDDMIANRQKYAHQLYSLQRQADIDAQNKAYNNARIKYYDTRDDMAQQKAELEKLKAIRVVKNKDGSLMKFDPSTGTVERLTDADPLYTQYVQSQINRNNRSGSGGNGGGRRGGYKDNSYEKTWWYDENGNKHETRVDGRGKRDKLVPDKPSTTTPRNKKKPNSKQKTKVNW